MHVVAQSMAIEARVWAGGVVARRCCDALHCVSDIIFLAVFLFWMYRVVVMTWSVGVDTRLTMTKFGLCTAGYGVLQTGDSV
jgi:hypothetical protein